MVSHTSAKFGGQRHLGNGDMFLVCHLISQDHVTKRYNNMGKSPWGLITILPNLMAIDIVVVNM